jgi:membrane associated rhomboid family serine protease
MITAPVGFQCPACVKGGPKVRSLRSLVTQPRLTQAIIAVNVVVAVLAAMAAADQGGRPSLLSSGNGLARDFALFGPAVAGGEWWRLVTSGFLHYGLLHLGFNMFILLQLGTLLEPALGRLRLAALYLAALLGGGLGVLLIEPDAFTAGASGAVFGLMGATVVVMRSRGADVMATGLPMLLGINLVLTFAVPGISIGGHLGGLLVGTAGGAVLSATEGRSPARRALGLAACVALGLGSFAGALAVAGS